MRTTVKFSEDVVPLGDLKVNPGKVVRRASESGRPVLLTSRGRGVAVVQTLLRSYASSSKPSVAKSESIAQARLIPR
jgi:prevent-host-death family protein